MTNRSGVRDALDESLGANFQPRPCSKGSSLRTGVTATHPDRRNRVFGNRKNILEKMIQKTRDKPLMLPIFRAPCCDPIVQRLGHRPFTAVTGVRIPVGSPFFSSALRATLVRGQTLAGCVEGILSGCEVRSVPGCGGERALRGSRSGYHVHSTLPRQASLS